MEKNTHGYVKNLTELRNTFGNPLANYTNFTKRAYFILKKKYRIFSNSLLDMGQSGKYTNSSPGHPKQTHVGNSNCIRAVFSDTVDHD